MRGDMNTKFSALEQEIEDLKVQSNVKDKDISNL